ILLDSHGGGLVDFLIGQWVPTVPAQSAYRPTTGDGPKRSVLVLEQVLDPVPVRTIGLAVRLPSLPLKPPHLALVRADPKGLIAVPTFDHTGDLSVGKPLLHCQMRPAVPVEPT